MDNRDLSAAGDLGDAANVAGGDKIRLGGFQIADFSISQSCCDFGLHDVVGAR